MILLEEYNAKVAHPILSGDYLTLMNLGSIKRWTITYFDSYSGWNIPNEYSVIKWAELPEVEDDE